MVRDVAVIGAGISGLTLARALRAAGRSAVVLERSRGVGGRCATRRIDGQPVDHGVAFLHGRDPRFLAELDAVTGATPLTTNFATDRTAPTWSLSGQADWVVTPTFFVGARAGYYFSDFYDDGIPKVARYLFSQTNIGLVGLDGTAVPSQYQRATGFATVPTNSSTAFDQQTRFNFQVDSTVYFNLGGQHTVKGGVQIDQLGNDVISGEQGNLMRLQWGQNLSGARGNYGYYQVRSNGPYPRLGFITEGDVRTTNVGLFIQDAWTVNNKLTVNVGLRTEKEDVPAYSTQPGIPQYAIKFKFSDKLAPRVGFAYDLKGDGRWKAYGSWGIFYDIMKLELPRGSFGGDKWLEYYYSLDTYVWDTLNSASSCPPACPGTLLRGPIDFRHVSLSSDYLEPNLKPMQAQEASFGLEHQLSPVMAVSARYVHKWLVRAVEDTGFVDEIGNELYVIANPGEGLTEFAYSDPQVPLPMPKRIYDSVEFAFTKNLSNNWYFRGSYLWSRLYGNYSGLSQTDENGRMSPNVGRLYDYPIMSFDQRGQPVDGRLATDRPMQIKAQFIYQFNFGTSLGLNEYIASGIPVTREVGVLVPNNFPQNYLGRMSDGRMPTFWQTDLSLQHSFRFAASRQLALEFNITNLFNQRTATNKAVTEQKTNGINFDQTLFYQGKVNYAPLLAAMAKNPQFLKENGFQAPLSARFGVRFLF